MPAVLKPGSFRTEPSKLIIVRSTLYTCTQLSKVWRSKFHIMDWCDLCLSQKECSRLRSPIVWLKSSLGRNETEGVLVLAFEKLFSWCFLSVKPSAKSVWSLTEQAKYIEMLLFKNFIRNTMNENWFPVWVKEQEWLLLSLFIICISLLQLQLLESVTTSPCFYFPLFQKCSVRMFWEKSMTICILSLTICILNSPCLGRQNKNNPLRTPVPSYIILIIVHTRLPQQSWAR